MTLEKLAELTDLSVSYLSRLESGKRNLSTKIMPKIAGALGVKPAELIDSAQAWLEIDITGIIKGDHEIVAISNGHADSKSLTTDVPAALGLTEAALVVGNGMSPRYDDGNILTYVWHNDDIRTLIGKECVVTLTNGRTYLKTLSPGSAPGRFHLSSFNAPTIFDAEVVRATSVGWINRA